MCTPDAPDPPDIKIPQYMTNPFLDADRNGSSSVSALKTGRSSLKIPLSKGMGLGFSGRNAASGVTSTLGIQGNRSVAPKQNLSIQK